MYICYGTCMGIFWQSCSQPSISNAKHVQQNLSADDFLPRFRYTGFFLFLDVAELMRLYLSRKLVFPVYCMHFTSASQCYVVDYLQINSIEELCCLQTGIM